MAKNRSPRTKARISLPRRLPPKTVEAFSSLSGPAQDEWIGVTRVLQRMRKEGLSLTQASKEAGVPRKSVLHLAGTTLRKRSNGSYATKPYDRLLRVLIIPSRQGQTEIAVRDSRTASKIAAYSDAVQRYVRTGDDSRLKPFKKLQLKDTSGETIQFLTDPKELMRLGHAGVLSFESLYARRG